MVQTLLTVQTDYLKSKFLRLKIIDVNKKGRVFMKKIAIAMIVILSLTGCSTPNVRKQPDTSAVAPVLTTEKQEQDTTMQEPAIQASISDSNQPNVDENWFTGFIGDLKIHAKIEVSGDKVSGIYYYDQYKTNIKLEGYIDNIFEMKEFKVISLTEDTDKKGEIKGVLRTNDYIQGYWKSGDAIYPMYLIREGLDITLPKKPSREISKFDGHWTGTNSGYFASSHAYIKALFDDLIYYELEAFNGTHSGVVESFGIIDSGSAKTVFKDTTYDEKHENVFFEFKIEDDLLKLNSNMYDYMCGMGVMFDSEYVLGDIEISMPTALEVGIVETEEQDKLFKKLVGDKYSDFISYTTFVDYSEVIMDGEKVKAGKSYLRGAYGCCFYIISSKHIYAAIIGDEEIYYYTNDKNYAKKIPEPMAEWAGKRGNIIFNYKELK